MVDRIIGEYLVESGKITSQQNRFLCERAEEEDGNTYRSFVQTVVDHELLTEEQLTEAVKAMCEERGYGAAAEEALRSDEPDRIVPLLIPEGFSQYGKLVSSSVKALMKLVDKNVSMGTAKAVADIPVKETVSQVLFGEPGVVVLFTEEDGALLQMASVFGREDFEEFSADCIDAIGELMNCVNGLYVSAMSRQGQFLELRTPEYEKAEKCKSGSLLQVPILLGDKRMTITVGTI